MQSLSKKEENRALQAISLQFLKSGVNILKTILSLNFQKVASTFEVRFD